MRYDVIGETRNGERWIADENVGRGRATELLWKYRTYAERDGTGSKYIIAPHGAAVVEDVTKGGQA